MHELVERIKKPELCYVFAKNAIQRGHDDLAIEAYRRAVDLRAAEHEVDSEAELMALKAFYAYEEALSHLHGKRKRATGTWQMVNRYGILPALQKRLESKTVEEAIPVLEELKMADYSFQAVARAYAGELMSAA
jgi:hypothetical protein